MWTPKIRRIAECMHQQREWWVNRRSSKETVPFEALPECDKLAYKMVAERILKITEDEKDY
ncbi:MAG: hypothetical protein WC444_04995 [Candidatus Paceibacterota bacterium]